MAQAASTYLGEQRRRSTRIEQTSAVIVRGVDLLGQPFEERAAAQDLSFHGCRYASKHHLPKNTWITLEVPSSGPRSEAVCVRARVAWIQRPRTLRDLFQVGVELERGRNIWGLAPTPSDWSSGAVIVTASTDSERTMHTHQANADDDNEGTEISLEACLRRAFAHTNKDFTAAIESGAAVPHEEQAILEQLRIEFVTASKRMLEEARTAADEAAKKATDQMRSAIETDQGAMVEAFRQKWIEALEHGKVDTKAEIASALTQDLAIRMASFEEEVRGSLAGEWNEKLGQARVERSQWEMEMKALRDEIRANTEASERRSEERLAESLEEIRREWESSGIVSTDEAAAREEAGGVRELVQKQLAEEMDTARAQWHELLESSLDTAARRLNDRLNSGSQDMVRRTEQEVAVKIEELQKESGFAVEAGQAALSELRSVLQEELSKAKTALDGIEQSAGRFSEYSRQLEAASQDSLNELRQRLESNVARHSAELDRHAAEAEKAFDERATQLLEQMSRDSVSQGVEQIGRAVAAGLANAAKATEELAAREEQAEGILRIHRERLRQASEQAQREGAANLASQVQQAQTDLDQMKAQSLTQWKTAIAEQQTRAAEEMLASLTKETEQKLSQADAKLLAQAQRAIDSAQQRVEEDLHLIESRFRGELAEIETSQILGARERLALEAHERLESAKNEFARAAEMAGLAFGEAIEEEAEKALESFSANTNAKIEDGHARLVAAGENALAGIQSHAQSSFEHYQEQLAIKAEQALQRASEMLGRQLESTLERFRAQGESRLEDWSAKQDAMSAHSLEARNVQLQAAASSWVEMTLERLDSRSEDRIDSAVHATENAIREACVDIFENIAQMMRKQLQGTLEIRPTASGSEMDPQEHRASA